MRFAELAAIAIGLSMDSFAAAVCKGMSCGRLSLVQCLTVGLYFGLFQAFMPLAGFLIGASFPASFTGLDHWIAFFLLAFIGAKTILDVRTGELEPDPSFHFRSLFPLAVATSLDALSVGVSFSFLNADIRMTALLTGLTAFSFSAVGARFGAFFSGRLRSAAGLTGGIVLILTGANILIGHLKAL